MTGLPPEKSYVFHLYKSGYAAEKEPKYWFYRIRSVTGGSMRRSSK